MARQQSIANPNAGISLARESVIDLESTRAAQLSETHIHWQPITVNNDREDHSERGENLRRRDFIQCHREGRNFDQLRRDGVYHEPVGMRSSYVTPRQVAAQPPTEARPLPAQSEEERENLERPSTMAGQSSNCETEDQSKLVIATFNCEKWKSNIMRR